MLMCVGPLAVVAVMTQAPANVDMKQFVALATATGIVVPCHGTAVVQIAPSDAEGIFEPCHGVAVVQISSDGKIAGEVAVKVHNKFTQQLAPVKVVVALAVNRVNQITLQIAVPEVR
jgi:hypothetical protein